MFAKFEMPRGKDGSVVVEHAGLNFDKPPILVSPWRDMPQSLIELAVEKMQLWTEQQGFFSFSSDDSEAVCYGWEYEIQEGQYEIVDWNELSRMGLMYALNVCVFHSHGFAVARDPANGISKCFLFDNIDKCWSYDDATHKEEREKLANMGFQIPELAINDRI